jgi:hypothetical protein
MQHDCMDGVTRVVQPYDCSFQEIDLGRWGTIPLTILIRKPEPLIKNRCWLILSQRPRVVAVLISFEMQTMTFGGRDVDKVDLAEW